MAMELLKCIICPKQPFYSDVSHLLTHVSSKGHLSHLHKLQVRSHQEVEAGRCLASYNQWYQQHGIADLLSERMQQKEAKQANKRAGNLRRAVVAEEDKRVLQSVVNPNIFQTPWNAGIQPMVTPRQTSKSALRSRRRIMQEEMDDPDYVLDRAPEYGLRSVALSQLTKQSATLSYPDLPGGNDVDYFGVAAPVTPECSKLKGTIWPGMTMFDAATEELQRKRNQKKDGSVLRSMQANSVLIEPMEATYSPGGTMRRRRHMNELECETDLIEGETPVKKQSVQRKRKSPKKTNKRATRRYTRRSKTHRKDESTESPSTSISPRTNSTSPDLKQSHIHSRAPCIQSEGMALKLTNPDGRSRRPKSKVSIFTDDAFQMNASIPLEAVPNPFLEASQYFRQPVSAGLSTQSTPWSQPQSFYPQEYDPFRDYRHTRMCNTQLHDIGGGKENENPLSWKHEDMAAQQVSSTYALDGNTDDFDADLGPLSGLYSYTKNPLVDDFFFHGNNQNTIETLR